MNKKICFSLLVPTRNRPDSILRLIDSLEQKTADIGSIELLLYFDEDDLSCEHINFRRWSFVRIVTGPRKTLSVCWNVLAENAGGEWLFLLGDDVIFRTQGWDTNFSKVCDRISDRIGLVFCNDGFWRARFAAHFCISKTWVNTVGRFVPPYFPSDFNDLWLDEVATRLGRRFYVPNVLIEHMHPNFGKAELDVTHLERLARHASSDLQKLYDSYLVERQQEISLLNSYCIQTLPIFVGKTLFKWHYFNSQVLWLWERVVRKLGLVS